MFGGMIDLPVTNRRAAWLMLIGLCGGIASLDLVLPWGVAIGMSYAYVVFIAARYVPSSDLPKVAALCTGLVLVGAVGSPVMAGVPAWIGNANRVLSLALIWFAVTFLFQGFRMKQILQAANAKLEKEVAARMTELEQSHRNLRALTGRLLALQEGERQQLARDLHDDFSQRLGLVMLDLEWLDQSLPTMNASRLGHAKATVSALIDDGRRLAHDCHPSMLKDLGVAVAIRRLLDEWAVCADVKVSMEAGDVPPELPSDVAICLYRIAQESLSNIAKHSRATAIEVFVGRQPGGIELRIRDNGVGCSAGRDEGCPQGLGLLSMKERAVQVGGEVVVESPLSGGTLVQVRVPIRKAS